MYDTFPYIDKLLAWYKNEGEKDIMDVNAHIHTPYSFSAFENIEQAVQQAVKENVKILGINDFLITKGYSEFIDECKQYNVFPLLNIEFIGIIKTAQKNQIRINDPNNPGRIYVSGKGLKMHHELPQHLNHKLQSVIAAGQKQMEAMVEKLNSLLLPINHTMQLSIHEVQKRFAKYLIRERHLAKAIRIKAEETYPDENERLQFYKSVFDQTPTSSLMDFASLENEIRSRLLKAGGKAFIAEDVDAFMSLEEIMELILASGGIPTYPLLLDYKGGEYTEYECRKEDLLKELINNKIYSIEFIPGRNSIEALTHYTRYFYDNGFVVTFGTEHNAPGKAPLKISCRGKTDLNEYLKEINFKGACVIAGHQYMNEKGIEGYEEYHKEKRNTLEKVGRAVITYYLDINKN